MIVSASRRTDIPAYYGDWLMGRIEAGSCSVRNPFDARRSRTLSLSPKDVDFLVLWTRDPRPFVERMRQLDDRGIRSYVQMTITGYPAAIEPGAPRLEESIGALRALAKVVGSGRVLWRYDPIFVAAGLTPDFHRANFRLISRGLEGWTTRVTLSLLDEYVGTAARLARAGYPRVVFGNARKRKVPKDEIPQRELFRPARLLAQPLPREPYPELLADLADIARSRGMTPVACAEPYALKPLGIEPGSCVDAGLAASLWGVEAGGGRDPGQRGACLCAPSVDIGAYGSCPRGCSYCYANRGSGARLVRGAEDEAL
jgi:hypothetical protein